MKISSFEFIAENAQLRGRELAYVDESHEVTFREFDLYTRRIASFLKEFGIRQGDLVATILPPYLDWHFTFALQRLGIATMPKNNFAPFDPQVIPDWLITLRPHDGIRPEKTLVLDASILQQINLASDEVDLPGFTRGSDLVRLFTTSGTSGDVKYISVDADGIDYLATRKSSYDLAGLDQIFSMYLFGSGQTYGLALKSAVEGKPYFSCGLVDYRIAKLVSNYPIRTLIGSPTQVSAFLDIQRQTGTELPRLSTVIMGGSPPGKAVVDRIQQQLKARVFNAYGSTEAGNISIEEITEHDGQRKYAGALMHSDVTLQIVDESDTPVANGVIGRVRYTRPGMAQSYFKNESATRENFKDGYFYPGDLGFVDNDGKLVLEGRSTEIINLGGVKINPEAIEQLVRAQLGVRDCAAFAVPGPSGVEVIAIALVVDKDFSREHFEKVLEKKSPHPVTYLVEMGPIERNPNGKVLRAVMTEKFVATTRPESLA